MYSVAEGRRIDAEFSGGAVKQNTHRRQAFEPSGLHAACRTPAWLDRRAEHREKLRDPRRMCRPGRRRHEVAVGDGGIDADGGVGRAREFHFGRAGRIGADASARDDVRGCEDLRAVADRRDRLARARSAGRSGAPARSGADTRAPGRRESPGRRSPAVDVVEVALSAKLWPGFSL